MLEGQGSIEARAAARLLGDPALAAFAADPDDPTRFAALRDRAKTGDGFRGLLGAGTDETQTFSVLAEAWVAAALANATPAEQLLAAKQDITDDTLLHLINLGLDSHAKHDAARHQLDELLTRQRVEPSRLIVGDPFIAQDVDLTAFKMASDVTADTTPLYVPRDIDAHLDQLLTGHGRPCGGRDAGGMLAFRSAKKGNHRVCDELFYELRAALGRLNPQPGRSLVHDYGR